MWCLRYGLAAVLLCSGAAVAADLELQPKGDRGTVAPAAPPQMQSPDPASVDKAKPALTDDKRMDDLQPPAERPAARDGWWQNVVRSAPGCRTFSDGCRQCDANFNCSGLPIACQPKEFACIDPKP